VGEQIFEELGDLGLEPDGVFPLEQVPGIGIKAPISEVIVL
jgi:hypothetical protein